MKKIIYDLGAGKGENLEYYLNKSELVVAYEADKSNYIFIITKFKSEIKRGSLIVENCIVTADANLGLCDFYVHKKNHLLGQFPKPNENNFNNFTKISLKTRGILSIFKEYGKPFYIKIDLEEYDHIILEKILRSGINFTYLSVEIKDFESFKLFSKFKKFDAFKIVNGHDVHLVYKNFQINSAGPFGKETKGHWAKYDIFEKFIPYKLKQIGWFDLHCSNVDLAKKELSLNQVIRQEKISNLKVKYKKKFFRILKKFKVN
ncbi:hypothetical protein OAB10_04730 [Candidatus Pelagibacter sp.]|nr:hypothetical protein [Candidatus Pelagibacter sp.]